MSTGFEGIRVLDSTVGQQGPAASVMLGDLGADVIKIEDPRGDLSRDLVVGRVSLPGNRNYHFESNNRNKRGMVLNLKTEQGRQVLYELVKKSDVFVQNWRKGVAEKLGVDYATLARYNPKLVYAWGSSFGPDGPDSGDAGVDIAGLARSGIMLSIGHPDWPPVYPRSIADQVGAMMLAWGILAALVVRERNGVGQEVNTSLLGSTVFIQALNLSSYLIQGEEFGRRDRQDAASPLQNYYRCKDDRWLVLAMARDAKFWHDFCTALGIDWLEFDPKFAATESRKKHSRELIAVLDGVFATRDRPEWLARLGKSGNLIYNHVNTLPDLMTDPQILANKYIIDFEHPVLGKIKEVGLPAKFSRMSASIRMEAPEHGQHTEEVLRDILRYTPAKIAELRERGAI